MKSGNLNFLEPSGPLQACNGTALPLPLYKGADKSLAQPTSQCILFDGYNISFDASLVIYINSTNIPHIMIINRIYMGHFINNAQGGKTAEWMKQSQWKLC